jgi:hypothetical protein
MELQTTYEVVTERYSDVLEKFEKKRVRSKAKHAQRDLKEFKFYFLCCMVIQNIPLNKMLEGAFSKGGTKKKSLDNREKFVRKKVEEYRGSTRCMLKAASKNYILHESIDTPQEVLDPYYKQCLEEHDEQVRWSQLSKEDQEVEVGEIIKELSQYPGFTSVNTPKGEQT